MEPSTPQQRELRTLYCNIMAEIKQRLNFIIEVFAFKYQMPEQMLFELAYLELRMVCELIALGCLVVHGDTPGTRSSKIRSAHQADKILTALEQMHPRFFPVPGVAVDHPKGLAFIVSTDEYMTKDD